MADKRSFKPLPATLWGAAAGGLFGFLSATIWGGGGPFQTEISIGFFGLIGIGVGMGISVVRRLKR
jgi:hypothetical protein